MKKRVGESLGSVVECMVPAKNIDESFNSFQELSKSGNESEISKS